MAVKTGFNETKTTKTTKTESDSFVKNMKKSDLGQFLSEIEKRAYELFLERQSSNMPSDEMGDWLQAEAEIKKKYNI
ncbi:MAG: hypothetical protein A2355_05155 [Spirochaetes bacterium RIFOXYB1_FULL_32_8]|nr:MAG: hypothetical protein A2355_05155 [Spirochaetes bacterium RIFOXYB1_FULL_32_8]